jgi:hypothetical protein
MPDPESLPTPPDGHRDMLLTAAIHYRRMGMSVFPIDGNRKPMVRWSHHVKTPMSQKYLHSFISKNPSVRGLAAILGRASHFLACRDFDSMHAYEVFVAGQPELARRLPTSMTNRGAHVWFRSTQEYFRAYSGDQWVDHVGEYRGTSAQVAYLPPTLHPKGKIYQWVGTPPKTLKDFLVITDPIAVGLRPCLPTHTTIPITPPTTPILKPLDTPRTRGIVEGRPEEKRRRERKELRNMSHSKRCQSNTGDQYSDKLIDLIELHQPPKPGTRNQTLRYFVAAIRLRFPDMVVDQAIPSLVAWFKIAKAVVTTQDFSVSESDFRYWWVSWKPPVDTTEATESKFRTFESVREVCEHLSSITTGKPFYLSARHAEKRTGIPKSNCHRHLLKGIKQGWLELVQRGVKGATSKVASYYRYVQTGDMRMIIDTPGDME